MRRSRIIYLSLFLLVLAAGAFLAHHLLAAETPLSGTWKVKVLTGNDKGEPVEATLALVKVSGKSRGEVIAINPDLEKGKVQDLKADAKSLHFTLATEAQPFSVAAYAPAGDTRPKKLLGSIAIGQGRTPAILELTDDTEITKDNIEKKIPATDEIEKLAEQPSKKRLEALEAFVKKHDGTLPALLASQVVLGTEVRDSDSPDKQVRAVADLFSKQASAFGPEMEQFAIYSVARGLLTGDHKALALDFARKAEEGLPKDAAAEQRFQILSVLQKALTANGKKADAAKLTTELDEMFEKFAVPFEVKPFKGREGDSSRVVLVELFTGVQCPPCVAADVAFDAALKAYKPDDVAFLQYHLHIPGPDPLTNKSTEERSEFYGDTIRGTPTTLVDGKATTGLGGSRGMGKASFETLRKQINKALETAVEARLKLTVQRNGDKVDMQADVSGLKKAGKNVRLRFVLVENVARYQGGNSQRLHHHVVRDFPGGVEGQAVKSGDTVKASVALDELRTKLKEFIDKVEKNRPVFNGERPLDFKNLKIVAFIQDDDSKKVLQAAQADVPEAK